MRLAGRGQRPHEDGHDGHVIPSGEYLPDVRELHLQAVLRLVDCEAHLIKLAGCP